MCLNALKILFYLSYKMPLGHQQDAQSNQTPRNQFNSKSSSMWSAEWHLQHSPLMRAQVPPMLQGAYLALFHSEFPPSTLQVSSLCKVLICILEGSSRVFKHSTCNSANPGWQGRKHNKWIKGPGSSSHSVPSFCEFLTSRYWRHGGKHASAYKIFPSTSANPTDTLLR